jgi:hypothetical protein
MAIGYEQEELEKLAAENYGTAGFFNLHDFEKDLANILTAKKMVARFLKIGMLNDKLLINNIVMSLNAFGVTKANRLFWMVCTEDQYSVVKPILQFLGSHTPHLGEHITPCRVIVDVLRDVDKRYNLNHLN